MIDMVGAIAGTAVYAVQVGALVGLSSVRPARKFAAFVAAAIWGILIVAVAILGGFASGATGPLPGPVFAFAVLLVLLFGGWVVFPRSRAALLSVPLPALVALNIARVGGLFFLLLAAHGRMSGPFPPFAGWGDIITGLLAFPLAFMAMRNAEKFATPLALWNAFGAVDLINSISLGLLSAPGTPFRVFTEGPGTLEMTVLPWLIVPTMLVPIYLLIHLAIAAKLKSLPRAAQATAMAH
jgi:hypothetical protein